MEIENKELFIKAIDEVIDQPLDGLLYDLDLLPEQLEGIRDLIIVNVITRMKERLDKLGK